MMRTSTNADKPCRTGSIGAQDEEEEEMTTPKQMSDRCKPDSDKKSGEPQAVKG